MQLIKYVGQGSRSVAFSLGLVVLGVTVVSAAPTTLNLSDAVRVGLRNNPKIDVAFERCMQGQGIVTQAQSGYLPTVSVEGGVSQVYVDDLRPEDEDSVLHGGIQLSQLIYDFGKTTGAIDASQFSVLASESFLHQYIQDVVLDVRRAYYTVLKERRLVVVAKEAITNYSQHLYRAERYYKAGIRTRIDVTNAKVNLSNAKLNLVIAESNYKSARVALEQALGQKPYNGEYVLLDSKATLDQLAPEKPEAPEAVDQLLSVAYDKRADMRQLKYLAQASESNITEATSGFFPSINAVAGYDSYSTDLTNLPNTWNVGVALSWQIFSGFQTEGEIAEAKAQFREVQASTRQLEQGITQEVTESYLRAIENRDSVDLADEGLGLSRENLELANGRYESGLSDLLEFNDAQLNLTTAQSNLVENYYDYLISLSRVQYTIGVTRGLSEVDEQRLGSCQVPVWQGTE